MSLLLKDLFGCCCGGMHHSLLGVLTVLGRGSVFAGKALLLLDDILLGMVPTTQVSTCTMHNNGHPLSPTL